MRFEDQISPQEGVTVKLARGWEMNKDRRQAIRINCRNFEDHTNPSNTLNRYKKLDTKEVKTQASKPPPEQRIIVAELTE